MHAYIYIYIYIHMGTVGVGPVPQAFAYKKHFLHQGFGRSLGCVGSIECMSALVWGRVGRLLCHT